MIKISKMHNRLNNKKPIWRQPYVNFIKDKMAAAYKDFENYDELYKKAISCAIAFGIELIKEGETTLEKFKDASWEAFDGFMEACIVETAIQRELGLQVTELNPDDFIFQKVGGHLVSKTGKVLMHCK